MAAAMGIFDHVMTETQTLQGTATMPGASAATGTKGTSGTNGSNGSSDTSSNSATVSANDFLTLLVTEMKNQDPTADTDPNEYINQLVQVNSLEQLIDINQTLTTGLGVSPAAGEGSGTIPQSAGASGGSEPGGAIALMGAAQKASAPAALQSDKATGGAPEAQGAAAQARGNLSVPGVNHAAQRVGHALAEKARVQPTS